MSTKIGLKNMTKIRNSALIITVLGAQFMFFSTGCERSESSDSVYWNDGSQTDQTTPPAGDTGSDTTPGQDGGTDVAVDEVAFSSLHWEYGGVDGSGAALDSPRISSLSSNSEMFSFKYVVDLSGWGLSHTDAGALACLFVKETDGVWRGGKFDWISSSRNTREFKHLIEGYNGWTLSRTPNPCEIAFVIVDRNLSKRSNVIKGTWHR